MYYDLQMFDEEEETTAFGSLDGIDADIVSELTGEEAASEENSEETTETETQEEPKEESGDADTDTKQYSNEGHIPYARFKEVNESKKNAEARIRELEAQLKEFQQKGEVQKEESPAPRNVIPPQVETPQPPRFTKDQLTKIAQMAVKSAREELGMSDEDAEDLEFSDDQGQKVLYQQTIANHINRIKNEAINMQRESNDVYVMRQRTSMEFDQLGKELNSHSDAQARWDFIGNEYFNTLDEREKVVLDSSFNRLRGGQGTDADIHIIKGYFKEATQIYESKHSNKPTTNDKFSKMKSLPKAPNVGGKSARDVVWDADSIADALNSPGGVDNLPPEILQQVLRGVLE